MIPTDPYLPLNHITEILLSSQEFSYNLLLIQFIGQMFNFALMWIDNHVPKDSVFSTTNFPQDIIHDLKV